MKNAFYLLGTIYLSVVALLQGAFILKPLFLGALLAILISPLVLLIKRVVKWHALSYILAIVFLTIAVGSAALVASTQLMGLFSDINSEKYQIENLRNSMETYLQNLGLKLPGFNEMLSNAFGKIFEGLSELLASLISGSASTLLMIVLAVVFGFFFSAYHEVMKESILKVFDRNNKKVARDVFRKVPRIIRDYIRGMSIVMIALALISSLAYWAIGIKYALIWGILTGILAFIPYIGSLIALILPLTYTLIESAELFQPLLLIGVFTLIQQIEGNFLTPKIVGESVNINPLAALLGMIIGAKIWGIFGVFISIIATGILKIVLENYNDLRPLSDLLGDEIIEQEA